jgi:tRNA A-37 threonylcarbamoyl transferase component Bud32
MIEPPFQLLIKNSCSNNRQESLRCLALLRAISGRRRVYDALWNNREVIVKVFPHKISANRHLKREWRGLCLLRERGLNAPEPLFFGKTVDGSLVVVMEKITDSSTAIDVFNKATSPAAKLNLLILACKELAKQHSKGVLQKDLHLGNFLLQGENLFTVDPAQMCFLPRQANRSESIPQLALLASALAEEDVEGVKSLCEEYAAARSWKFSPADMTAFWKKLAAHGKRIIKKGLSKCLRTNKRHIRLTKYGYRAVAERDFFEKVDFAWLLQNVDDLMRDGQILKDGNTCFVSRINLAGKEIVVKRYNYKGFIHSVRHTLKRSRARRNWLHAHRLGMLNIPTAAPLAFIEKRKLMIVCKSYFITEYIPGRKLDDFLQDDDVRRELRMSTVKTVEELLNKLSRHRISHGDTKRSNILILENKPFIIDLDSMTAHKSNWLLKIRRKKDMAHLAGSK